MNNSKSFIYSIESLDQIAEALLFQYPLARKWAFYGSMGMGKTTLIKALVKKLGSIDEGSSPTFAIANQYQSTTGRLIYHLDLFRLKSLEEAFHAGMYEIIQSTESYCFVEWPELIENWLDDEWLKVHMMRSGGDTRWIKVLTNGAVN